MIRHYDMASGEPLNDSETDSDFPVKTPPMVIEERLETVEATLTDPMVRRGTMPSDLIPLDIEAFLRRQR